MRNHFVRIVPFLAPFLGAALLGGCAQNAIGDEAAAEMTADSGQSGQSEAAFLATNLDGTVAAGFAAPATAAPETAAAYVAAHMGARYTPAGCVTATASGATVVAVFDECTGPRGLRALNGTVDLAFSAASGGALQVVATATGFEIGGATLDLDTTAVYTDDGTTQSLAVTTQSSGIGPLGYDLQHDGSYTATWTGTCATVDGAWSTEAGERSRSTTANLTRCDGMCPSGTVTRDTVDNRTITVTFDGTATAQWSSSAGRSGTIQLLCGQ